MKEFYLSERLLASWQSNAAAWTEVVRSGQIESRHLVTDQAIVAAVLACQPRTVLDLGCGEGWLSRRLSEHCEVVGVDGSASLIEAARQAQTASPFELSYQVLSYAELAQNPLAAGRDFDLIVANFALLDQELEALFCALHQLSTSQSIFLIQTLHPDTISAPEGWQSENFSGFGSASWTPMPWYFRPLQAWQALLTRSGWQVLAIEEPRHPQSAKPLSLLLKAQAQQEFFKNKTCEQLQQKVQNR